MRRYANDLHIFCRIGQINGKKIVSNLLASEECRFYAYRVEIRAATGSTLDLMISTLRVG